MASYQEVAQWCQAGCLGEDPRGPAPPLQKGGILYYDYFDQIWVEYPVHDYPKK